MENIISTSLKLVMSWNHDLGSLCIALRATTAQGPGERSGEALSAATAQHCSTNAEKLNCVHLYILAATGITF